MSVITHYRYIIIGSGIAGLYTALLARLHGPTLILTKGSIEDCNTQYAQGGIAASVGENDSPELHSKDTIAASSGLYNSEAVNILSTEASDRIADLIRLGVQFDTAHGALTLANEAAHSVPRILHAGGDATGQHIEMTLASVARLSNIYILENKLVTEISVEKQRARGVVAFDSTTGQTHEFSGDYIILASGGAGQLFRYTTNTSVATGDGVALAYRAGAEIVDMEFYQFHPTALRIPNAPSFLISEATRGEGATLVDKSGQSFMKRYHPLGDLAPRDIVSRAIASEMNQHAINQVWLKLTHLNPEWIITRFPNIYATCYQLGLDITKELIPVAPAAHYMMGGVRTSTWGETSVQGRFACGEVACTGVHGANRLASNSLLETVVFGKRIISRTTESMTNHVLDHASNTALALSTDTANMPDVPHLNLSTLQNHVWNGAGIIRSREGLATLKDQLIAWSTISTWPQTTESYELQNLLLVARLITEAALLREESRGAHYRIDCPDTSVKWENHITSKKP